MSDKDFESNLKEKKINLGQTALDWNTFSHAPNRIVAEKISCTRTRIQRNRLQTLPIVCTNFCTHRRLASCRGIRREYKCGDTTHFCGFLRPFYLNFAKKCKFSLKTTEINGKQREKSANIHTCFCSSNWMESTQTPCRHWKYSNQADIFEAPSLRINARFIMVRSSKVTKIESIKLEQIKR